MRTFSYIALVLSTALAGPSYAQYRAGVPSVQPLTTADQLAAVMRRVAAAPRDVLALVSAGELSIKLDDMSAAAAFFARAEKIDPRNGRVKAGMAAILVRAERPGEALRYFQMAEQFGHPASRFASDRGLALDLLGEQERAQRDYRLALRTASDDETVRRYALSLGISGRQALALEQLEPLTRRQDRAAWRVRAFVLAMNGDVAGASTIATTMMPRGMAGGLQPFFERLPALAATDRAFAVHFGEVRPTPARLADARLKPSLAPLGPDPFAPVQVAVRPATPSGAVVARADRRRGRPSVDRRVASRPARTAPTVTTPRVVAPAGRQVLASVAPPIAAVPAPRPPVAVRVEPRREPVAVASVTSREIESPAAVALEALAQQSQAPASGLGGSTLTPVPTTAPVQVASTFPMRPAPGLAPRSAEPIASQPISPVSIAPVSIAPVAIAAGPASAQPGFSLPSTSTTTPSSSASVQIAAARPSIVPEPIRSLGVPPVVVASAPTTVGPITSSSSVASPVPASNEPGTLATPTQLAAASPVATPQPGSASTGVTNPGFTTLPPASVAPGAAPVEVAAAPVTAVRSEDSILARIVASITIPGEELGIVDAQRRAPTTTAVAPETLRVLAAGEKKAESQGKDRAAALRTIASVSKKSPAVEARSTSRSRTASAETSEEGRAATRNGRGRTGSATSEEVAATSKPKTAAEKRLAGRKNVADEKAELAKAEKAKTKGEPERIWVQVAGGASEGDLPKAWGAAQKKAAALKGRVAYTTPLRATNRVVTGPFKTDAEARAFVNQLAKQGVSAFQFTSVTGQKMTKLTTQ